MKLFYEVREGEFFVGDSYNKPYPAHVHNVVEIVYLLEGNAELMIGQKSWELSAGDTAVIFPTIPHAYERFSPDARGLAMFFMPYAIAEFNSTLFNMRPERPVLTAAELGDETPRTALKLYEISHSDDKSLLKAYLHLFLARALPLLTLRPGGGFDGKHQLGRVIRYVREHYKTSITLKSAAEGLGMSESHLSHIFAQQLNIGFRQYVNSLRVDHAKQLLRDPALSVTEICYMCGYENPRTFNRAFRTECGMTPSKFRAAADRNEL